MENKSKKLWILLGVAVVIVIIIIVAATQGTKKTQPAGESNETGQPTGQTPSDNAGTSTTPAPAVNNVLKDTRVEAPNANPITKDNVVVNQEGKATVNSVAPTSPLAPAQTGPVKKENLAPSVIKIDVNSSGYTPKEFTVKPGAPVTISLTSVDEFVHSLVFDDASLSALGLGVYSKETRAISFNAPTKAGEYAFFCNVGNHRSRGEAGKMIVK
ncbi:MAG: cupredoxin domain-containing protein [Patescibacteria group bacterium]